MGRQRSKDAARERYKAQKKSLSAANTETVMHQELAPCLHHSFECSILPMDTLFCVDVLNQPTAQPACSIWKHSTATIQKNRSTFLSKSQGYLSPLKPSCAHTHMSDCFPHKVPASTSMWKNLTLFYSLYVCDLFIFILHEKNKFCCMRLSPKWQ